MSRVRVFTAGILLLKGLELQADKPPSNILNNGSAIAPGVAGTSLRLDPAV
jgi:hypothetical protein